MKQKNDEYVVLAHGPCPWCFHMTDTIKKEGKYVCGKCGGVKVRPKKC